MSVQSCIKTLGHIAQLVARQIADPGLVSSIPAWSHTFAEIMKYFLWSFHQFNKCWCQKKKYVQEVLVNDLVKLAQEKVCLD